MAFDWTEFLKVSEYVTSDIDNRDFSEEAAERYAVSRIYYAIFGYIRDYERVGYRKLNTAEDHGNLVDRLYQINWGDIACRLEALRKYRNYCDYSDYNKGSQKWRDITDLLGKSEKIRGFMEEEIL